MRKFLIAFVFLLLAWATSVAQTTTTRVNKLQVTTDISVGNGSNIAPSVHFAGSVFDGFFWRSPAHIMYSAQGNPWIDIGPGLNFANSSNICFAPDDNLAGDLTSNLMDTGIKRLQAGIISFWRCDAAGTGSAIDLGDPGTRPACAVGVRGTIWIDEGGAGVQDSVAVCAKDNMDNYAWRTLY